MRCATRSSKGRGPPGSSVRCWSDTSDCGWRSSACRRPARGRSAAPTSMRSPSGSSARATRPRKKGSTISCGPISAGSGRRASTTSRPGPAFRGGCSSPRSTASRFAGCPAGCSTFERMTRPPAETPARVHLLPTWDAVLLVHARRTGVDARRASPHRLRDEEPRRPCRRSSLTAAYCGAWRLDGAGISARSVRGASPRASRAALLEEGERLAALLPSGGG